ncbi:MAG: FHA domain-containing protein [Comamonas sp.]
MLPELLVRDRNALILRSLTLEDGFTTFGRIPTSHIVFDDMSVSRNHGAFYHRERFGILTVEDHGSMNGTFVNGVQIKRKILYSGDIVTIGDYEVYIRHGSNEPKGREGSASEHRAD